MDNKFHESVMVDEVTSALHVEKAHKYIDATLGNGGHALAIVSLGGKVLGIELDPKMIEIADRRLGRKAKVVRGNFTQIDRIAKENGFEKVDGILFDLGVTNVHLKDRERGFSFENRVARLDMRIDPESQGVKASDLINVLREDQLEDLFKVTLEPGAARWISKRITNFRKEKRVETVGDMLDIVSGLKTGRLTINEATLPFLALRIAVNGELTNLEDALPKAFDLLDSGGRLVVISFHSKEDQIVKNFMSAKAVLGTARQVTFKPQGASTAEIEINRRARSAKMRVLEKI